MTAPNLKRHRRRFLQFSLRALLVFVLLVSLGMSWLGVKLDRARKQREAVKVIVGAGGEVYYDYHYGDSPDSTVPDPYAEPSAPEWARALLGDHFFFEVVCVSVYGGDFGDDEAIYLAGLTSLQKLWLPSTQISDVGFERLKGLTNLTILDLSDTATTDSGLECLEGLTSLTELWLTRTQITNAGLEHVGGLTSLSDLYLCGTHITEAGLEYLKGMTNLEHLFLDGTQINDAGLEHLEGLTSLTVLDLSDTQINDAGLDHLEGLSNLTYLDLSYTQITPEGVEKLQKALPHCEIMLKPHF